MPELKRLVPKALRSPKRRWPRLNWAGAIAVILVALAGLGASQYLAGRYTPAVAQAVGPGGEPVFRGGPPASRAGDPAFRGSDPAFRESDPAFRGSDPAFNEAGPFKSPQQALEWVRLQRSLDETDNSLFWGGLPPPGAGASSALRLRLYALLDQTLTSLAAAQQTGARPAVDHGAWRQLFADLHNYFAATPPALIGGPSANSEVDDALRNAENAIADLPAR